jgi:hypothetical protein
MIQLSLGLLENCHPMLRVQLEFAVLVLVLQQVPPQLEPTQQMDSHQECSTLQLGCWQLELVQQQQQP